MIGIRLKEADSEAPRCRDINFYRKKTQMFRINGNLDIYFQILCICFVQTPELQWLTPQVYCHLPVWGSTYRECVCLRLLRPLGNVTVTVTMPDFPHCQQKQAFKLKSVVISIVDCEKYRKKIFFFA